ncbi:type IV pili methyl-accepting chemotaxis transducer N-terminal domain-containing protein [Galbibacter sp. EGI 63066]|uniref:sensor histidine kinase n=1 Tax=Galbibacter sp. EGI 63066 TaxID=2993559 RepID=UPI002249120B|nr:ATP-binding protein [Galbibacter sp. EGI 63066]MCX2679195.1 type IV pili methyl-accepting chemotaxis transducer N-terminal domain-containing protein [Galbibacter sp. EGI 63066]
MSNKASTLDQNTFKRLRQLYVIALSLIAISVIVSQILVQRFLIKQQDDAKVVNIAGRQRMLSQKLTKEVLLLSTGKNSLSNQQLTDTIENTLGLWATSHKALQNDSINIEANNSDAIKQMFGELQPAFDQIQTSVKRILQKARTAEESINIHSEVDELLNNEQQFLTTMDRIVNQYDLEATEKVEKLRRLELILFIIALGILLAEFLFIFLPAARSTKEVIGKLLVSEKNAKEMAYNADMMSMEKERSVKQLKALSLAMEQTLLYARIDPEGHLVHLGNKFSSFFNHRNFDSNLRFSEIISTEQDERETIEKIIADNQSTGWQGEVKGTTGQNTPVWLEMSVIPYHSGEKKEELLIICFDITKRKLAQLEVDRLTREHFEAKMDQQKTISAKIIENQEQEQNRIAKDIHDGIGQMLTGLKFNIESIDIDDKEKASEKIEHLKELTTNIIKGVRTATFNLAPPELTDHGVVSALVKLTQELAKFTGKNITLINKTDFNSRLDSLIEINIYRIVQEAVNNAIKYAESSHIVVSISHSKEILSIIIDDNGKGFDIEKKKPRSKGEGGMGLTFMKERIKYINGRLFLNSNPGEGTRITLNIPIKE